MWAMASSNHGGYLRGPWWKYPGEEGSATPIRRCFVIAWGDVVIDTEEEYKTARSVRFVIKTGRGAGRKEKHLVCVAYGETMSSVVMRAMEKGDTVFCAGTWVEKIYMTKKGKKLGYEMQVHFIVPQGLIGFLLDLYSAPEAHRIAESRKNEEADVWEGD